MHDELDTLAETLIDDAVKSYTAAEPSPELATSILRHARQQQLPRHTGWKFAAALALLAPAAVVLLLLRGPLAMPPAPAAIAALPAVPRIPAAHALARTKVKTLPTRAHIAGAEAAESTVRPLPTHYTRQELAMLAFVQRYPKEAAAIAQAQRRKMQPLSPQPIAIARLRIAPLSIPALNP